MKINKMSAYDSSRMIRTNCSQYTIEDCYDSGFRDGRDGIRFYPCTVWELNDGDSVLGAVVKCATAYADGYKMGRAWWRIRTGGFPSSGDSRYDRSIAGDIERFKTWGRRYAEFSMHECNGDSHFNLPDCNDKNANSREWAKDAANYSKRMNKMVRSWGFNHLDFGVGFYPTIQEGESDSSGTIHFDYEV